MNNSLDLNYQKNITAKREREREREREGERERVCVLRVLETYAQLLNRINNK